MSNKTERIVIDDLDKRMDSIEEMLEAARQMLVDTEYLQCAVRLQEIDKKSPYLEIVQN